MMKKMVSYKKLYEELKEKNENEAKPVESDYLCPLCNSECLENNTEIWCTKEGCTFDKTFGELVFYYAESKGLERNDLEEDTMRIIKRQNKIMKELK